MSDFFTADSEHQQKTYELYGVVFHIGYQTNVGHYTSKKALLFAFKLWLLKV